MASGFYQCLCGSFAQRVNWRFGDSGIPEKCDEIRCSCGIRLDVKNQFWPESAWNEYMIHMSKCGKVIING